MTNRTDYRYQYWTETLKEGPYKGKQISIVVVIDPLYVYNMVRSGTFLHGAYPTPEDLMKDIQERYDHNNVVLLAQMSLVDPEDTDYLQNQDHDND